MMMNYAGWWWMLMKNYDGWSLIIGDDDNYGYAGGWW